MNIRDMQDVSYQFNLILQDLKRTPLAEKKQMSGGLPDEAYGELVLRQIMAVQDALKKEPEELERTFSASELHVIFHRIERLTSILGTIHTKKNIDARVSQSTIKALETYAHDLHKSTGDLDTLFKYVIDNKAKQQGVNSWGGFFVGLLTPLGSYGLSWITPTSISNLDSVIQENADKLEKINGNQIAQETARGIAKLSIESLKDEILNVNQRDPLLRASFLKEIFIDPNVSNPKPTKVGALLITILKDHPEFLEKVITANVMKGLASLYSKLGSIQKNKEYFLVNFFDTCLHETLNQFDATQKTETTKRKKTLGVDQREQFLSGNFQRNLSKALMELSFPGGEKDLVLPGWSILQTADYRQKPWELINSILHGQFNDTFRSFSETDDLKKILMVSSLKVTNEALQGADPTTSHVPQLTLSPEKGLATFGIVFIFFQVLFSTLGTVISSIFSKTEPEETPYSSQKDFNFHLLRFLHILQEKSGSRILQLFIKFKGDAFVESVGPILVQALKKVNLSHLLTDQLDGLLTQAISPEGSWDEQKKNFTFKFTHAPRTLEELKTLEQSKEAERVKLDKSLNSTRKDLGKNLTGLITALHDQIKLTEPEPLAATASSIESMINTIQQALVLFANKSSYKFIQFCFWLFNTQSLLREVGDITSDEFEKLEMDSFLMAISQFGIEKLAPHATGQ